MPVPQVISKEYPQKTLLIEILVKECTAATTDGKVTELTLFPTEKDLWTWDPLGIEGQFS